MHDRVDLTRSKHELLPLTAKLMFPANIEATGADDVMMLVMTETMYMCFDDDLICQMPNIHLIFRRREAGVKEEQEQAWRR